mmetsp:Transcript_104090/g.279625  ORF Transcript_104090/g.279625 Transcript_104090/m.279625 type:complete len:461 (+) Transcript_104090:171-1553(+)
MGLRFLVRRARKVGLPKLALSGGCVLSSLASGLNYVAVPSPIAAQVKAMALGKALHVDMENLSGQRSHFVRLAVRGARPLLSPGEFSHAEHTRKAADKAKHTSEVSPARVKRLRWADSPAGDAAASPWGGFSPLACGGAAAPQNFIDDHWAKYLAGRGAGPSNAVSGLVKGVAASPSPPPLRCGAPADAGPGKACCEVGGKFGVLLGKLELVLDSLVLRLERLPVEPSLGEGNMEVRFNDISERLGCIELQVQKFFCNVGAAGAGGGSASRGEDEAVKADPLGVGMPDPSYSYGHTEDFDQVFSVDCAVFESCGLAMCGRHDDDAGSDGDYDERSGGFLDRHGGDDDSFCPYGRRGDEDDSFDPRDYDMQISKMAASSVRPRVPFSPDVLVHKSEVGGSRREVLERRLSHMEDVGRKVADDLAAARVDLVELGRRIQTGSSEVAGLRAAACGVCPAFRQI